DLIVTGVQTCALPICHEVRARRLRRSRADQIVMNQLLANDEIAQRTQARDLCADRGERADGGGGPTAAAVSAHEKVGGDRAEIRSEERRVGKECRARW